MDIAHSQEYKEPTKAGRNRASMVKQTKDAENRPRQQGQTKKAEDRPRIKEQTKEPRMQRHRFGL